MMKKRYTDEVYSECEDDIDNFAQYPIGFAHLVLRRNAADQPIYAIRCRDSLGELSEFHATYNEVGTAFERLELVRMGMVIAFEQISPYEMAKAQRRQWYLDRKFFDQTEDTDRPTQQPIS